MRAGRPASTLYLGLNPTNDEVDVIVPNSEFINGRVVNWTFGSPYRRLHIPFGVAYGSDKHAVKAATLRAAETLEFTAARRTEAHPLPARHPTPPP